MKTIIQKFNRIIIRNTRILGIYTFKRFIKHNILKLRKVAFVKISTKKEVTAYITKQGNNLQEYSIEGLVQIYLFKNLNSYVWP